MAVFPSPSEQADGAFSAESLERLCEDIRMTGYAVVGGLVAPETCALINESVLEDVATVLATGQPTAHEKATASGHLQLGARRYAPYVQPDLIANPLIESVVAAVLGQGAWLGFYNGNVNCPRSGYQPLHYDRPFSWTTPEDAAEDGRPWPPPTTTLSCSIAVTDINAEAGATESYPGTQNEVAVAQLSSRRLADNPELVESWGPPTRMEIPAGGICFRDPRMWHRGVPNLSDRPRPMLALTYHSPLCRHWRGLLLRDMSASDIARCEADATLRVMDDGTLGDGRLVFHASAARAFDRASPTINRNARFVDAPVDHLSGAHEVGGARLVEGARRPTS